MTTVVTRGAASAQALGYAARSTAANYIEDVFSTYLYTGNSSTQTITNGIDLSTKGGLVWSKWRSGGALSFGNNRFYDTARGVTKYLDSNSTNEERTETQGLTAFNSNGYSLGLNSQTNVTDGAYASWTFRKQAKFFDVVTYTGNGASGYRMINHSLGSVPGFIIIKPTSTTGNWVTLARQSAGTYVYGMFLNTTGSGNGGWDPVANGWLTSTQFTTYIGNTEAETNTNGVTYVAYLFAHNAGGFGASGTDNVITCGSFTSTSGTVSVNLGYEPQWILVKDASASSNWSLIDVMRQMSQTNDSVLSADLSDAEYAFNSGGIIPTATGFNWASSSWGPSNETWVYIAIRRGPMRTPTSGTSVFSPVTETSSTNPTNITVGFPTDLLITRIRTGSRDTFVIDRLRGTSATSYFNSLYTNTTGAEVNGYLGWGFDNNTIIADSYFNPTWGTVSIINYAFRRAPGFFDVVCYTGTGSNTTQTHNLGVVPELMIVKGRSGATAWQVYSSALANTEYLVLNTTAAKATGATRWNSTTPTSTVFSLGTATEVNTSAATYVAYLFATVAGVSKVGSYTGTGTTKQIDCGFTGGARFVLIKRTDSTGDWYVWDSARGIVAGNDPYLLLNSLAAEVTNTDYVDTYSAGFEISSTAPAAINANGGTFIFLAIA